MNAAPGRPKVDGEARQESRDRVRGDTGVGSTLEDQNQALHDRNATETPAAEDVGENSRSSPTFPEGMATSVVASAAGTAATITETGACSSAGARATEETRSGPSGDGGSVQAGHASSPENSHHSSPGGNEAGSSSGGCDIPVGCASGTATKTGCPVSVVADVEPVSGAEATAKSARLPSKRGGGRFSRMSAETASEAERLLAGLLLVDKVAAAAAAGVSVGRQAADRHHTRRGHRTKSFFQEGNTAGTGALRGGRGNVGHSNHSPYAGDNRSVPAALAAAATSPSPQSATSGIAPPTSVMMEAYGGYDHGGGQRAGAATAASGSRSCSSGSYSGSSTCSPHSTRSPPAAAAAPACGAEYFTSNSGLRIRL